MIKKTITYDGFEGEKKTRDFYFHMNQVEFAKLNGEYPGGLEKYVNQVIEDRDETAMLRLIDTLVSRSYGKFDEDDEFTKIGRDGRPLFEKFVNTDAYDKLIIELVTGENNIVAFLKGILPKEVQKKMEEKERELQTSNGAGVLTPLPKSEGTN